MVAAAGRRPRVSIELCGDVRLEVEGSRREGGLPGRLGRVLLAYLVLNHRRPVTRDELVDALWPERPPRDPGGTLSTLLSGVRRCLGPGLLEGRSELRLRLPADARVDVDEAGVRMEQARTALATGDHGSAMLAAEAVLDVLERGLLPGFDAPWLEARRRDLVEARVEALEVLATAAPAGGDAGLRHAQWAARQMISLAPYRESGHLLLMDAQARQGNAGEALASYDRLRRLLRDELGTTPSPQARAAHQRLLEAPVARPAAATAAYAAVLPPQLARKASRRFVGRGGAKELLRARLAAAESGERRFVFLAGEPGIGKTSLAAAIAREAHARGDAVVLYGRSDEDALVPYQPFVEMIGHAFSHGAVEELARGLGPDRFALGRLVPQVRRWLPAGSVAAAGRPDVERYRLLEAVVAALEQLTRGRIAVLVFDDLHWADPPTLQLLRHLARAPVPERLLVLGAYRDAAAGSPLDELIAGLRREQALDITALGGLDPAETEELAQLGVPAARRLHELTGGNPLFLKEMLRVVGDAADPQRALDEAGVPEGIAALVVRRAERLGAHDVLALAAVAGRRFRVAALERAAGRPVVAALDRALAAGLLVTTEDPDALAFSHALVRQALYERLSAARRIRLHRRMAEALEAGRAELRSGAAELAHHFFLARHVTGPEPAVRYAREAADRAADSLAWEDEALQLSRALEADAMREPPDPAQRTELLLAHGEALTRAGFASARAAFGEAAALARGRAPEQLARAAIGYGGRYYEAGVADPELIALLREALAALPPDEGALRPQLVARLAEILHFAGDPEASLQLSSEAMSLAERLGDDEVLVRALAGRHVSLLHVSHLDERLAIGVRLLRLADAAADPEREMQALQTRIFDLMTVGDLLTARQLVERLDALARELRQPLFAHFAVGWRGTFALVDGRLEDAERLAGESLARRQALGTRDAEDVYAAQLFMIRRAQGRVGELLPAVLAAVARHPGLAAWRAALPLAHLAAGDRRRAGVELERIVDELDGITRDFFWLTALTLLAEAAGLLHAARPAGRLYGELVHHADRWVQIGYAASDGPVARSLGLLAAAGGDEARAVAHLERALELCVRAGAPGLEARARADVALARV